MAKCAFRLSAYWLSWKHASCYLIADAAGVGWNGADMGGDNVGAKFLRQIEDAFGTLHPCRILFRIREAGGAEIAAEGGNAQAVIAHKGGEIPTLACIEVFGVISPETAYIWNPCAPISAAFLTPSGILSRKQSTMTPIGTTIHMV